MITVDTNIVNAQTGERYQRHLYGATDRWGKRFFVDAERWQAGRVMLIAYKRDGVPVWERGHAWQREKVYHRENIAQVTP